MRLRFLAAALTAFAALPAIAEAASGVATANVNMRSGPSTAYPAVVVIPVGARLEIHGCLAAEAWCDVSFARGRGWVSGRYIQATYGRDRVYVDRDYYRRLGIPTIQFNLDSYWDRYYRQRDFYRDRNDWRNGPDRRPPPPPRWNDDRRRDDVRRDEDWRRRDDNRRPDQRWDNRDGQPGWRDQPPRPPQQQGQMPQPPRPEPPRAEPPRAQPPRVEQPRAEPPRRPDPLSEQTRPDRQRPPQAEPRQRPAPQPQQQREGGVVIGCPPGQTCVPEGQ